MQESCTLFNETYPGRVVYAAHNRGVVARWQLRNDGRLPSVRWPPRPLEKNIAHLAARPMIPPIIVVLQLSFEAIKAPMPSCTSKVGLWPFHLGILYRLEVHRAQDLWHE